MGYIYRKGGEISIKKALQIIKEKLKEYKTKYVVVDELGFYYLNENIELFIEA